MSDSLNDRVTELEVRIAFQDDLLAALDATVAGLVRERDALTAQVEHLRATLEALRIALGHDVRDEPPPPHW